MDRLIKVTGEAVRKLRADRMEISAELSELNPSYEDALRISARQTESIKTALEKENIDRKLVKTVSFQVRPEYEGYSDEKGNWRQRFSGFRASHSLKISLDLDHELLGKVIGALSSLELHPELQIGFTVKEPERERNALMQEAMRDAAEKAALLADAAGVRLGQLMSVDYSYGARDVFSESRSVLAGAAPRMMKAEAAFDAGMEPLEIELRDSVCAAWMIA